MFAGLTMENGNAVMANAFQYLRDVMADRTVEINLMKKDVKRHLANQVCVVSP